MLMHSSNFYTLANGEILIHFQRILQKIALYTQLQILIALYSLHFVHKAEIKDNFSRKPVGEVLLQITLLQY